MAYFSNGSEGMVLDELCLKCIHGWDGENNRQGKPCTVFLLQAQWNYSQLDREKHGTIKHKYRGGQVTVNHPIGEYTREAIVRKEALDLLVPQKPDELCSMFVPVED